MTNEEILEKQVEALEKLIQLKQAVIEEQEAKINKLEAERYSYPGLGGVWQPSVPFVQPYQPYQPHQPWVGGGGAGGAGYPGYPGYPGVQIGGGGLQIGGGFQGGGSSGSIIVSNTCPDGTPHQYPPTTSSTPCCSKCGQYGGLITTATFTGQAQANGNVPVHTTGYVQPVDINNNVMSLDGMSFSVGSVGKR